MLRHPPFTIQNRAAWLLVFAFCPLLLSCALPHHHRIVVGSKNFTEQTVLGELLAQEIESKAHVTVERRFYLAGSYICHQAILAGRIDIYPEYTGTALTAILKEPAGAGAKDIFKRVQQEYAQRFKLAVMPGLGFNNTFAMIIRGEDARQLHLRTLSQASQFAPHWRVGCGFEFSERPDGFRGLVAAYGLRFAAPPRIMDLGLLYRSLQAHEVDIVAGNSTDGLIAALGLEPLEDDRHYFPPYEAVPVIRETTLQEHPELRQVFQGLAGRISEAEMRRLNYAVDGQRRDVKEVVRDFIREKGL